MLSLNDISIVKASDKPTKTYKIDLKNGKISGYIDELEAVQQYIHKTLITPRFKCLIFGNQYGSEIESMMTTNHFNRESIKKLLPSLIENALTDARVISVSNFEFTDFDTDGLLVTFDVDTVYGVTKVKEVPINV